MNNITLIGRLTFDVEMRFIPTSGTPVANLSIAVGTGRKDKQGNEITDFIPVRAYGKTAENCSNYLSKGSLVAVQGSMKVDKYVKEDGEKRTFAVHETVFVRHGWHAVLRRPTVQLHHRTAENHPGKRW